MERKRGTTVAVVAALIIAVVSLGIAFAAFSSTLTINGSATVQASTWNIFFTTAANGSDPGTTGIALPAANIAESNIQAGIAETVTASATVKTADFSWTASFTTPGDKVVYDFYVRNTGSYAAKITSINAPQVTCTPTDTISQGVCGHIHYGLYKDANGTNAVAQNDEIAAGGNAHYYVIAYLDNDEWAPDGSDLPTATVNVNTTQISITYTQK